MSSDSSGAPGPKESREHKDKGIKKFWKKLTNQAKGLPLVQGEMNISQSILILKSKAVYRIF